ncbi:hypothetical protein XENOCAPTIV_005290 [Xenoophorus captivus]|uniref:Uncharacterized protein n=1 Tax=Xenoophorus captivus TaxID=1517983 RepID=A0ABV0S771_9TELE
MMPTVSQSSSSQQNPALDCSFTSDKLPENGAIVFGHNQAERVKSAQPKDGKTSSVRPESSSDLALQNSENKSGSTAPVRDIDVTAMLKQIRRALGVREPCRAAREARRQNGNVQAVDRSDVEQPAGPPAKVSTRAPPADTGVSPSTVPPLKQKQTHFKETQETNETKSPQLKEGPVNDNEAKSQEVSNASTSVSRFTAKMTPAETNMSKPCKVRVAHKSRTAKAEKETVSEVNSLRAKRIEILQGMQGYSGASPAESPTTFSPGAASTISTTSFATSLSQQHPAGTPASFIPLPHPAPLGLPAVSLKQEITHSVAAGQASQLFLPSAVQPTVEGSNSAHALLPESSARQREQEMRDRSKCVKTEVLEMEIHPSDFVEGTEQDTGNEPAGDKLAGKRQKKASHVDEGNESDSSVEVVNCSNTDVIDIEESEWEESAETDAPAHPQMSVNVEFSYASTQTSQQWQTER